MATDSLTPDELATLRMLIDRVLPPESSWSAERLAGLPDSVRDHVATLSAQGIDIIHAHGPTVATPDIAPTIFITPTVDAMTNALAVISRGCNGLITRAGIGFPLDTWGRATFITPVAYIEFKHYDR